MMTIKEYKILIVILFLFNLFLIFNCINANKKNHKEFNLLNKKNNNNNTNNNYTDRIPIFTFHRLVPDEVKKEVFSSVKGIGSIKVFEEMIKYLHDNGYKTISTEEFYKWYIGKTEYDKKTVLITIDDGFYEDYYLAYPIIKKYKMKATSFVVGSRIKEKTAEYNKYNVSYLGMDVINKVRKEYPLYQFQSHSFNFHYIIQKDANTEQFKILNMTYKEIEEDILKNKKFNFTTMAYPFGGFTKEIMEILKNAGYLVAFRFDPSDYATRKSHRFAVSRIKLNGLATIETLKQWLNY